MVPLKESPAEVDSCVLPEKLSMELVGVEMNVALYVVSSDVLAPALRLNGPTELAAKRPAPIATLVTMAVDKKSY